MPALLYRLTCAVLITASVATPVAPAFRVTHSQASQVEEGWATFYAKRRAHRRTTSGEHYDPDALVAAHPTLPLGTRVRVTRLETGASVVVRVIDRGPSAAQRRKGFIIDLSRAAAESLAFIRQGRTRVRLEELK